MYSPREAALRPLQDRPLREHTCLRSACHASPCSRNAALNRKVGKHAQQRQIASRQEPGPQFAHPTGRSPRGQEHRGIQVTHRLHYHAGPDLYSRCDRFTTSQLCIIFCLLLCIHKWIGQEHTKVRTCKYFCATAGLSKGIYRRRRYTQSRRIRETRFHEQTPASNLNIVSRKSQPRSSKKPFLSLPTLNKVKNLI